MGSCFPEKAGLADHEDPAGGYVPLYGKYRMLCAFRAQEQPKSREMHVSGMFTQKRDIDPIKQDIDPINDPINTVELSEREKKILELLRQDPTLTKAKMAVILGCSDATIKRALGSMVQKNVIRRIGSNKKGEWIINR